MSLSTSVTAPPPAPNPPPRFSTLHCTSPADIARCMEVRKAVFCVEQGLTEAVKLNNPKDLQSDQFLLYDAHTSTDVGTVRLFLPELKMGRLAVLPSLRGLRLGELILQGMEEHVRERKGGLGHLLEKGRGEAWRGWGEREGQVRIAAHCQRGLVQYYQRCGYEVVGGEFAEEGVPHVKVVKWITLDPLLA